MLPNPTILLGLLVGLLATAVGGYRYGYSRAEDAISARVAAAQVEAIDEANERTKAEIARTLEQAKREADARVRAAGLRRKGEIDAIAKARPDCVRDDESLRLLVGAIADANGQSTASSSVPDHVQPTPDTNRR